MAATTTTTTPTMTLPTFMTDVEIATASLREAGPVAKGSLRELYADCLELRRVEITEPFPVMLPSLAQREIDIGIAERAIAAGELPEGHEILQKRIDACSRCPHANAEGALRDMRASPPVWNFLNDEVLFVQWYRDNILSDIGKQWLALLKSATSRQI
jgi:hypothetical protein